VPDQPVTEPQDRREEEQQRGLSQRIGVRQDDSTVPEVAQTPAKVREAIFGLEEVQV
jgi:hypothetical protein